LFDNGWKWYGCAGGKKVVAERVGDAQRGRGERLGI